MLDFLKVLEGPVTDRLVHVAVGRRTGEAAHLVRGGVPVLDDLKGLVFRPPGVLGRADHEAQQRVLADLAEDGATRALPPAGG